MTTLAITTQSDLDKYRRVQELDPSHIRSLDLRGWMGKAVNMKWLSIHNCYMQNKTFEQAVFQQNAIFTGALYQTQAVFLDSCNQRGCKFLGGVYQSEAVFEGSLNQDLCVFGDDLHQTYCTFKGNVYQRNWSIEGLHYDTGVTYAYAPKRSRLLNKSIR